MKYFLQNTFRGFSDKDLWSLDYTLAEFILPRLVAFKELERSGIPYSVEKTLKKKKNESDNGFYERVSEKWDEILDKMIFAFSCVVDEEYSLPGFPEFEDDGEMDGIRKVKPKDPDEWAFYQECVQERDKKVREGLILFGKHFKDLWD